MKKTALLSAFALCCALSVSAQTKRIANRSHSGSMTSFSLSGDGNFGATPEMEARWRRYTDSVAKADSMYRADSINRLHTPEKPKENTPEKPKGTADLSKAAIIAGRAKRG